MEPLVLRVPDAAHGQEWVNVLDGGEQAYPRMLGAIERARASVHLEVYAFSESGIGARFVEALVRAARRGVAVRVRIDGWGSARSGTVVAAALRAGGCEARIHNRLRALLVGRLGRNHRKLLLVDDEVAFLGGINIGEENVGRGVRVGWADLALEIHGPECARLGQLIRREPQRAVEGTLRILLCWRGGGWRLRQRFLDTFAAARERIDIAHGYFLPDRGVVRAIAGAARRGVQVRLLLAGRSDVPFSRAATRSLYRQLLSAGVEIHEWTESVLHAKAVTVDGERLLVGSFNLHPFSLANLEALVVVDDRSVVSQAESWIGERFASSRPVTVVGAGTVWRRWCFDPVGRTVARAAEAIGRLMAGRRNRPAPPHRLAAPHRSDASRTAARGRERPLTRPSIGTRLGLLPGASLRSREDQANTNSTPGKSEPS